MNDLIKLSKKNRWWLWSASLTFIAVELFIGFYVYHREMDHGNDGLEILGTSLLLALLFALPAGLVGGLLGWLTQKLIKAR